MYKTFMKHAEKLTNSDPAKVKPALKAVKHFKNGDAAVTDSHRLYYAKEIHDKGDVLLTPKGKKLDENYPDITRLMPSNDPKQILTLKVDELIKGVDIILAASKYVSESPQMTYEENSLFFEARHEEVKASYDLSESVETKFISNAAYWMDALKLFKAFKYTEVDFLYYGPVRPFILKSKDEKLTALILPMRRY